MAESTATRKTDYERETSRMVDDLCANIGDPKRKFVDPQILRAYDAYLQDWRWNMATHLRLQSEYMPPSPSQRLY